jgi:hypothetical protein
MTEEGCKTSESYEPWHARSFVVSFGRLMLASREATDAMIGETIITLL